MRWITFLVLLYFFTAMGAAGFGGIPSKDGSLWPTIEFLPLLAIFYALYAVESSAPLAALVCGFAYDLRNGDFVGTNLIPLALVAWVIVRIRLSIFREHFISQVIMSLLGILAFAVLSALFGKLIGAALYNHSVWAQFERLAGNAVYTAIVAPVIFFLLFKGQGLLGFTAQGPRARSGGR